MFDKTWISCLKYDYEKSVGSLKQSAWVSTTVLAKKQWTGRACPTFRHSINPSLEGSCLRWAHHPQIQEGSILYELFICRAKLAWQGVSRKRSYGIFHDEKFPSLKNSLSWDSAITLAFNDHHVEAISIHFHPIRVLKPLTPHSREPPALPAQCQVSTNRTEFLPCLYWLAVETAGSGSLGLAEALGEEMTSPWILRCWAPHREVHKLQLSIYKGLRVQNAG